MLVVPMQYNHVCCFEGLDEVLDSEEAIAKLFKNVYSLLKEGGYFFGIVQDSASIWSQAQKSLLKTAKLPKIQSKNSLIQFYDTDFPNIGCKYSWTIDKKTSNYYLVHVQTFRKMAQKHGFVVLSLQNFNEFYEDHKKNFLDLLNRAVPKDKLTVEPEHRQVIGFFTTFVFQKKNGE